MTSDWLTEYPSSTDLAGMSSPRRRNPLNSTTSLRHTVHSHWQGGERPRGHRLQSTKSFETSWCRFLGSQNRDFFSANDEGLRKWKMDFIKDRIGVEVSFNHAEAIPWTFTRLNIAGESREVEPSHRIDVGVAFFATTSLKSWGRMDSAVGTYDIACAWLEKMRPIMPIHPGHRIGRGGVGPDGGL